MKTRKTIRIINLLLVVLLFLSGCTFRQKAELVDAKGKDPTRNYVVYEGVFLNKDDVLAVAEKIRGSNPAYDKTVTEFHVTTHFLPDRPYKEVYGQNVTVHVIGYKAGEVKMEDGKITHNEALEVELESNDPLMKYCLFQSQEGWHVTLSYEDKAFYTNKMDYSDAQKVDYTLTGVYGAFLQGQFVTYDANDVNTLIAEVSSPSK